MRSVSLRLDDLRMVSIYLGFVGENEHTHVIIDCKKAFDQYPDAIPTLTVKPPSGDPYPVVVSREGDIVTWIVTSSDLIADGDGELQLAFVENGIIMKSYKGKTTINKSIEPTGEMPTPIENWIVEAEAILGSIPQEIQAALQEAKDSGMFDGVGIRNIEKTGTSGLIDTYTITFTDDRTFDFRVVNGFAPTATVSKTGDTATITITDVNGTTTASVSDGTAANPIDDTAGTGDTTKTWSADKLVRENDSIHEAINQVASEKYTKPEGGIPASDIADNVLPVVPVFTDNLGTWSCDMAFSDVLQAINDKKCNSCIAAHGETAKTCYQVYSAGESVITFKSVVGTGIGLTKEVITNLIVYFSNENIVYQEMTVNLTDIIDDASGEGNTNKVWSADKTTSEISTLSASIEEKADKTDTILSTSLSCGRKQNTEAARGSIAFGGNTEASGLYSVAFGRNTQATERMSHALGSGTIANGSAMTAIGHYNEEATLLPEWISGKHYYVGNRAIVENGKRPAVCVEENSDATFDRTKWMPVDYNSDTAFVIGNGMDENSRSNALRVDWDGNEELAGDLTINKGTANEISVGEELSRQNGAIDGKADSSMMQKCDIEEIEATSNKWNKDDVQTGLLYKNGTVYTGGAYDSFRYNTEPISVEEDDVLSFYSMYGSSVNEQSIQYITCYDVDGNIDVSAGKANELFQTYTVPENVASVVISVGINVTNFMVIKNAEQTPTEYIPYVEEHRYYVAKAEFIPENVRQQIVNGKADEPTGMKAAGMVYGLDSNLNPVWVNPQGGGSLTVDDELSMTSTNPVQNKVISGAMKSKVDSSLMKKCELVEIEATSNKWNKDDVEVGMVHTNGRIYTGGTYDNYRYSDSIPVQAGDTIYFFWKNGSNIEARRESRIACYNANGEVMASAGVQEVYSFTIPNDVTSIIVTIQESANDSFMMIFNDNTAPSAYIPYREADAYYLGTEGFIPSSLIEQAVAEAVADKVDKDGINQVVAKNCEFVDLSPNLFDKTSVEVGLLNKNTGVVLTNYTTYRTSDWIEVEELTDYTFSATTTPYVYWCWYNSDKGWISGGESNIGTKQSPANAKYIRFSLLDASLDEYVQFEKGSTASSYREFGTGYIKPEYMPPEEISIVFNIPKKVYALVGYETNLYFENLVEDWTKYNWDVTCSKGMQMERGYRITPEETDAGTYTLTFTLSVGNNMKSFSTTLIVVSASAGSGVSESVIILGDSTTAGGTAVTKLNENLNSDVYNLSTIGTRGTSPNKHEGRSGWRFSTYFSNNSDNAFYNPSTQTFDASYYFANSGVAKPTWFLINLGINDVFGNLSDSSLASTITQCKEYLDAMIASINEASPNTKIGVCLTIPPNHSQDAFGKEYKCGQNRARYKRNNVLWVNSLIEEYDDREADGIYLIPIHAVLDTVYNMGFETLPVNARNTDITYQSPIGNGGVHPVTSGYWQIADQYTAFLKGNAT